MDGFKFRIGNRVYLSHEEKGEVIGRAEFANSENSYFIKYKAADGRMVEAWWGESACYNFHELEEAFPPDDESKS